MKKKKIAIDLFSGCGGLTCGLKQAGFDVIGAVEIEPRFSKTYALNHPDTHIFTKDIKKLKALEIFAELKLKKGALDLLAGCPPCQGFSTLGTKNRVVDQSDERNKLIDEFRRLVIALMPKAIMLENVPALISDRRFSRFCETIEKLGYKFAFDVLNVANYGVPQRRKRLILVASRVGPISLARPASKMVTVRTAIAKLPRPGISGDAIHDLHREHSEKVKLIIKAIPKNGGSRIDLPKSLVLECHQKSNGFKDVYGRMEWDSVAPTITGGCTNPSKGRFLHPQQNRPITLREAAILQGFPKRYKFIPELGIIANSLMIGNALPPPFIKRQAGEILKSLE